MTLEIKSNPCQEPQPRTQIRSVMTGSLICDNTAARDRWLFPTFSPWIAVYCIWKINWSLTMTNSWSLHFLMQELFVPSFPKPSCINIFSPGTIHAPSPHTIGSTANKYCGWSCNRAFSVLALNIEVLYLNSTLILSFPLQIASLQQRGHQVPCWGQFSKCL